MRNTIILLVIAIALGAYVYFYEIKGGEKREAEKEMAEKLFVLNADSLERILIQKPTETFEFVKKEDHWELVQPVQTLADESPLSSIRNALANTRKIRTFPADDPETYGLGSGAIKVTFSGKGIPEQTFKLGDRSPVGNNVYVTKDDSVVMLVSGGFRNHFTKSLFDYRDKKVIHFKRDRIKEIALKNKHGSFRFVKENGDWLLTEPIKTKVDNSALNKILNKLEYGRIKAVKAETADNLQSYGLKYPAYRVELFSGVEKARSAVSFSSLRGNTVYGKDEARAHIFELDSLFIKPFNQDLFAFREKKLFDFSTVDVNRINLFYKNELMIFEKDTLGNWHFSTGEKAKDWKVTSILSTMKNLEAKSFVDEKPVYFYPYGLVNPEGKVELFSGDDKIAELHIGKEKGKKEVYARNPVLGPVVTIDKDKLERIFPKRDEVMDKDEEE